MKRMVVVLMVLGISVGILASDPVAPPTGMQTVTLNGHRFTLPIGFEIDLVAGPSVVSRPITADFDDEGRLYVADSSGSI